MKYIITESQYNSAIDKFISYQFEPHEEKTSKEYPNSKFWIKDKQVIVEIENSKIFWVKYEIFDIISDMFSLEYEGTQELIKHWLEEHYNLGSLTPASFGRIARWKNIKL
jgi:hypothetical protein